MTTAFTPTPPATTPPRVRRPRWTRRGSVTGILTLLVILTAVTVLSMAVGSRTIPFGQVLEGLFRPDGGDISTIIIELRLPRTVLAISIGLCLGIAGALMQGHTRNPLAEPGLLGVSAGAAFAVVVGIYWFGVTGVSGYAWFALVGAGVTATAVFAIGSTKGGPNPVSLVLAGAAVTALLVSFTQGIVLRDTTVLDSYRFWIVGSAAGRSLDIFWQVLPFMIGGLVLAAISAPTLNLLQLGDDVARSLGLRPTRHKVIGIGSVMLLTGAATAACGPVAFVGLVVPHVARFLGGVDYRWLVPYAGLIGAIFVVLADIIGRVIARPGEVQVGIVMALVGGPIFIILVRRARLVKL